MKIGEKIKNERIKNNWTQEDLATKIHVSRSTISSWEVGRNYPNLEIVVELSDLFQISLDQLLREDIDMIKDTTKKIRQRNFYRVASIILFIAVILIILLSAYNNIDAIMNGFMEGWR